ncbi:MAG: FAD-binding oxidoreductase [Actinomycetota bacterium]|nr:FAD-binding oxidoreductase [Actinomycetota bacterium]
MSGIRASHASALAEAAPRPYWLDDPARPAALEPLVADAECDLAVVGGGYLGLWTALLAKGRAPERDVLVLEADVCGHAASGRNGGFCEASLTHGFGNGLGRWPGELDALITMGRDNLDGIERTVRERRIDCDFVRSGTLGVATEPHQVAGRREEYDAMRERGIAATWLDRDEVRARLDSPTFLAAVHEPDAAMVEPARLAWGLRAACVAAGVRIHEHTPAGGLATAGAGVRLTTPAAVVRARQVVLATNAFPPLLRRLRLMTVPVYDYALMTEPLDDEQRDAIGWPGREGLSDSGNQFVYSRTTRDGRILWGGYDAIYHFASAIRPDYDQRPETFAQLARGFFTTFPQLEGLRFTHAWGGVIDTCTRFTAFYGTALGARVGYALGFTGLGVGATRFAGDVLLDLLAGADTPRTRLAMVRQKPLPFPPEPLRWAGVEATRRSLARADANGGRENLWLRAMGRLGFGFDS